MLLMGMRISRGSLCVEIVGAPRGLDDAAQDALWASPISRDALFSLLCCVVTELLVRRAPVEDTSAADASISAAHAAISRQFLCKLLGDKATYWSERYLKVSYFEEGPGGAGWYYDVSSTGQWQGPPGSESAAKSEGFRQTNFVSAGVMCASAPKVVIRTRKFANAEREVISRLFLLIRF
jgi:hypothetical protein